MKYIYLVMLLLLPGLLKNGAMARQNVQALKSREQPEYPGGEKELEKYLCLNLRYPHKALEQKISGEVRVSFIIDEQGRISNVKTIKSLGYGCDEEAERVVKGMPQWKPAHREGREIKVCYILPVVFELPDGRTPDDSK